METARWLKERATYFIEAESYREAMPYLQRLISLPGAGPFDLTFAHFTLGEIHLHNGHYRLAQEHLRASMDIAGENSYGLLLLGQAFCGDGKFMRGREALENARRLNPKDEAVELSLGLAMCLKGDFDEAEEVYSRCIRINPDRQEAYVGLSQAFAGQGRLDKARETLEEAKNLLPLSLSIRLAIRDLGQLEEAHDLCERMFEESIGRIQEHSTPQYASPLPFIRTVMVENAFPPKAIQNAEKLWNDFIRVEAANRRKPEQWAAAVVYAMARLHGRKEITHKVLSERFGVNASTISLNFGTISRTLKISEGDKRYL